MLQIGPLTIGNTVVSTSGMMLMFMQPCSLPITPSVIGWLNSTLRHQSPKVSGMATIRSKPDNHL